jgi:hypothetical protein
MLIASARWLLCAALLLLAAVVSYSFTDLDKRGGCGWYILTAVLSAAGLAAGLLGILELVEWAG